MLMAELDRRWRQMFSALAAGDDLPPAARLRAEGLMEAVLLTGQGAAEEVDSAMNACYREAFGSDLAQDFGADWREFFPFPQIPAMARRAPVFPSTSD